MAPGKTRRRAAWAAAAALAATALFPGAARAHVKWFAEFGTGDPPAPLSAVLTPTFFALAALSTVAVGGLALLERRVERSPWYLRVDRWLAGRADHLTGTHAHTEETYPIPGTAAEGVAAFERGTSAWREVLTGADDEALDAVRRSTYPYGSDPEDPLLDTVWWVNQELLHHAAEIALLRDLYRARPLGGAGAERP